MGLLSVRNASDPSFTNGSTIAPCHPGGLAASHEGEDAAGIVKLRMGVAEFVAGCLCFSWRGRRGGGLQRVGAVVRLLAKSVANFISLF